MEVNIIKKIGLEDIWRKLSPLALNMMESFYESKNYDNILKRLEELAEKKDYISSSDIENIIRLKEKQK